MGTNGTATKEDIESFFDFDKFRGTKPVADAPAKEKISESVFTKENGFNEPIGEPQSSEPLQEQETPQTPEQATEGLKKALSGIDPVMAISLFDVFVSRAFAMGTGWFGYQGVSYKDYSLDEKEKKQLAPFFESIVVEWLKTLSPRDVFMILLLMIYGSKVNSVISTKPRLKKKSKPNLRTNGQAQKEGSTANDSQTEEEEGDSSNDATVRFNKDGSIAKRRGPKGPRS